MKRFEEIEITILKDFVQKQNSEDLRILLYEVNAILFKKQKQYALRSTAERLRLDLIEYGKKIKDTEVKKKEHLQKKNEMLLKLRMLCIKLQHYINNYTGTAEEENTASASLQKFQLGKYIKNKDKLTTEEIISLLKENKEIAEDSREVLPKFKKMQEELLAMLGNKYKIE